MCGGCAKPISYGKLYQAAFVALDRDQWLRDFLKLSARDKCMVHHVRAIRYLRTAIVTQSIFSKIDPALSHAVHRLAEAADAFRMHRTRRLSRRMLSHAYRPGGRMHRLLLKRAPFIHS